MAEMRREQRSPEHRFLSTGLLLTALVVMSPASALNADAGPLRARSAGSGSAAELSQAAVQVGSEAPDISLKSIDGSPLQLSALRGDKNVILVFFRGTW